MGDHFVPPFHAKVYVEVRHRDALRIQKALEQQVIFQRVEVSDTQCVGDQGPTARPPPRPHRYVVAFCPGDKLHDDEKIACKTHLIDDVQLKL